MGRRLKELDEKNIVYKSETSGKPYSFNTAEIKHTTLRYSLNKQHFFVVFILFIGLGGGFHA